MVHIKQEIDIGKNTHAKDMSCEGHLEAYAFRRYP